MEEIRAYYDKLAPIYDHDRFNNSYGKYIDTQEKIIIQKYLLGNSNKKILDLACGTGRFLDFANYGLDISSEMIAIAKEKYPQKQLYIGNAVATHFDDSYFDIVMSFHLLMHVDKISTIRIFNETARILKTGGVLIFDIPSKKRRKLVNYKSKNWHAANDFTAGELMEILGNNWTIKQYYGVAFFPIHRIPSIMRAGFISIDSFICRTFLKDYASYMLFVAEKK